MNLIASVVEWWDTKQQRGTGFLFENTHSCLLQLTVLFSLIPAMFLTFHLDGDNCLLTGVSICSLSFLIHPAHSPQINTPEAVLKHHPASLGNLLKMQILSPTLD